MSAEASSSAPEATGASASASAPAAGAGAEHTYLGSFGAYMYGHGDFCNSYIPGDRQGPGGCCNNVSSGPLGVSIESGNSCCGTTSRVAVVDALYRQIGWLKCHSAPWISELSRRGLVSLSAEPGCLIHGRGHPGFAYVWEAQGDLKGLAAIKDTEDLGPLVAQMLQTLGSDGTDDWAGEVDAPTEETEDTLESNVPARKCTCTGSTSGCFINDVVSAQWEDAYPRGGRGRHGGGFGFHDDFDEDEDDMYGDEEY